MSTRLAKRFYKDVSVAETPDGFCIKLDTHTLKTPGKRDLYLEHRAHAELIATEWAAQTEDIIPVDMPCTRLANVAFERTPETRDDLVREARNYAGSDLLCYRAEAPQDLVLRQAALWDTVLVWAKGEGVSLRATYGITAITQDAGALEAAAAYARTCSNLRLTLLVHFTTVLGSFVLAMAVMEKHLTIADAFELSRLDEIYQIETWGVDDEAQARTDHIARELLALGQFLT